MKTLYKVSGTLSMDFVGQIAYTVCLEKPCRALDVHLTFAQQHVGEITPQLRNRLHTLCREKYGITHFTPEMEADAYTHMKAELQLLVMMNDTFIGGIHRQMTDRHLFLSADAATEGGMQTARFEGVLKVIVVAFNVLYDDTPYTVTLRVEEE